MNEILFVINPISGGIDKTGLKNEITACCRNVSLYFNIIETTGNEDERHIAKEIENLKPNTVVACGGDGTINLIAHLLLGKGINLGIIPLGSANGLARELLIPKNIKAAVDIIKTRNIIALDVLRINGQYLSLHLSDVGFNAKLIRNFDEGGSRGKLAYATHFFKLLFKRAPRKYTFIHHGRRFKRRAEMVVFANASKYGTGAVVNPDGRVDDGKFEVCIFKPYPWYAIFRLAFDFFTGGVKRSPYVKIFPTNAIIVQSRKPVLLQVDGEVIGDFTEVEVTMDKEQLPVIVPVEFR